MTRHEYCLIQPATDIAKTCLTINVGLPLVEFPGATDFLQAGAEAEVDMEQFTVSSDGFSWNVKNPGETIITILNAGGLIPYIQAQYART